MSEAQRKADAAWEDLENMEFNDPNYQFAQQRYLDLAEDARKESNRTLTKIFRELAEKNEELESEVADLKGQMPAGDPCDNAFMEDISS